MENRDPKAVAALLACKGSNDVTTKVWTDLGWPFELWLRFVQLPGDRADANLKNLQDRIRA